MSDANKAIVQKWFDASNNHDFAAYNEICTPDYVHHDPNLPVQDADLETFKQIIGGGFVGAFPDLSLKVDDMIAEGDRVAVRWHFLGTHNGELPGDPPLPPTGKSISVDSTSVHRVADGRVAEAWVIFDVLGMMQQLGAIPS